MSSFGKALEVAKADKSLVLDYSAFDNLTAFAAAVAECAPNFLAGKGFPESYESEIAEILFRAESEANREAHTDDPDRLRTIAQHASAIAGSVERLSELSANYADASDLSQKLNSLSYRLEEEADANEPREDEEERPYESASGPEIFDIEMLFSEL
jgi:hypothetical protein